jgi:hypothetical protein
MLHFKFLPQPSLPKLAWCARLLESNDEIVIEHGEWVETRPGFFVEGAWDGAFEAGKLAQAGVLLGSGGQLCGETALFATTTHTKERLQSVRLRDELLISNSLAYLLGAAGDSLDVDYRYYERDFMTSLKGIRKAKKFIPTAAGRRIRLHYSEKIRIGRSLKIQTERYADGPGFSTFEEYTDVVNRLLTALTENACDPARQIGYRPLGTISTGYDSPAASVFARQQGCTAALTFLDARTDYNDPAWNVMDADDSGREIGKHLKIDVHPFSRNDYAAREDCPEAEFIATGNGGDDVVMCNAEALLPGTMLYTGFLGDVVWDCNSEHQDLSRDYVYKDPSGASFNEFRLRVGFIHVPVPLLTFARHPELHRISHSDAMAAWRVGGNYDRPIPRRLVESCGVPRHLYAQSKKAITQPIWLPVDFENTMLPASYRDLADYAAQAELQASMATRIKKRMAPLARDHFFTVTAGVLKRINWYDQKQAQLTGRRLFREFDNSAGQMQFSSVFGTLAGIKFHWAIDKVRLRYQGSALAAQRPLAGPLADSPSSRSRARSR